MKQLVQEKENSELKPGKLRLKIDLVSYPARAEVLVNMIMMITTVILINNSNIHAAADDIRIKEIERVLLLSFRIYWV